MTFTLSPSVASSTIALSPGQDLALAMTVSNAPASILVEGSSDNGITWQSLGSFQMSTGSVQQVRGIGCALARVTSSVSATINVVPFGLAGPLQTLLASVPAFRPLRVSFLGDSRLSTQWVNAAIADTGGKWIGYVKTARLGQVDTGGFDAANDSYSAYSYPGVSLASYAVAPYWCNFAIATNPRPDYVIEAFGFNDATSNGVPLSPSALNEFISQKEAIAMLCRSLGIQTIWATIYSANPGNSLYALTKPALDQMNNAIRARAFAIGVPVWDVAGKLDGQAQSSWYPDDRHYSGIGNRILSASCTDLLNNLRPATKGSHAWLTSVASAVPALWQYEAMPSNVTTASLGGYGGLTLIQTATQTDTNGAYTLNLNVTGSSNVAVVLERTYTIGVDRPSSVGSAASVGDVIMWAFDYFLQQPPGHADDDLGTSMDINIQCAGAGLNRTKVYHNFICNSRWATHLDYFTIPTGTTTIKFQIVLNGNAQANGTQFSIRNIALWNISKMGGIPK